VASVLAGAFFSAFFAGVATGADAAATGADALTGSAANATVAAADSTAIKVTSDFIFPIPYILLVVHADYLRMYI
jgi:hypothetical protein